jgi:NAD(P)-dependent dehydrogenase (short-subunit alcohol dehydrogenase family)/pimeloyl-ACP methyl ester carboxylesterase
MSRISNTDKNSEKYIEVSNGAMLHITDKGTGQPVVLIPGLPMSDEIFKFTYDSLVDHGYRAIGITLRGFGQSDVASSYDINLHALDLHTVLQTLNLDNVILGGYSYGGAIAAYYIAQYEPKNVEQLILISANVPAYVQKENFPYGITKETFNEIISYSQTNLEEMVNVYGPLFQLDESIMPLSLGNWITGINLQASQEAVTQGLTILRDLDLRPLLVHIKIPTTIFHDKNDKTVPFDLAEQALSGISNAKLVLFDQGGHWFIFTEVEKFNKELLKAIASNQTSFIKEVTDSLKVTPTKLTKMKKPKVWFITGVSKGFGLEIVRAALEAGDQVIGSVRNNPEDIYDILNHHKDLLLVLMDVTQEREVVEAVKTGISHFGRIDVVVNNAGFGIVTAIEEATDAESRRQYDTNVFGVLNVIRAVLPQLRKQRSGHIINISSLFGFDALPGWSLYGSTKFAIEGISKGLAVELAPFGIKVTAVEPGLFTTSFLSSESFQVGKNVIDDYKDTAVGQIRDGSGQLHGNQPGDPKKLAQVILKLVESEKPPLHLPIGPDSIAYYRKSAAGKAKDVADWLSVSESTNHNK